MITHSNDTLEAAAAWAAASLVRDRTYDLYRMAYAMESTSRVTETLSVAHDAACDASNAARIVFERFSARDARRSARVERLEGLA